MKKYTAEYFINKFEAIKERDWRTGSFGWNTDCAQRCVLGHCEESGSGDESKESRAYKALMSPLGVIFGWEINDGTSKFSDLGNTPKERVINALVFIAAGLHKEAQ